MAGGPVTAPLRVHRRSDGTGEGRAREGAGQVARSSAPGFARSVFEGGSF
ncbi:hypothetical protein B005_5253 [Nocardiopsis alba ATCC BAA-2165]|uniref:Uncharacterized protein n=1 Tax=Nocardiopsis alba (strain ATCC BAA-2165 / BE74) TaxID=1205910 RepID=J7L8W9_NOCAA|nr:hypothetical protein B005_5253 [Nocardiopsis alba ATCC BAA-2165]